MDWNKVRVFLFRLFYSTSFTIVFLLIVVLVLLTPADIVYQGYKARRWLDIIVIAGVYILTAILASLLYASRLYTTRGVIRDIPKAYLPVEKDDLPGKRVRHLIEDRLTRSATTAYLAKPRSTRVELDSVSTRERMAKLTKSDLSKLDGADDPTWGLVAHRGWTSPAASDLPPGLHFEAVIKELTDLVEAKAISLAPTEAVHAARRGEADLPDDAIVEVLQRPASMGMRNYIRQLQTLGILDDRLVVDQFLVAYETARFAPEPPTEDEFRSLMNLFAEILHAISPLDPRLLPGIKPVDDDDSSYNVASADGSSSGAPTFDAGGSLQHTQTSRQHSTAEDYSGDDEDNASLHTKPKSVGHSRSRPAMGGRITSGNSGRSLRQTRSILSRVSNDGSSRSETSVIRLTNASDPSGLPYSFSMPRLDTS